jgi:uncharacterized membrane protein YfcA
LEWFALAVFGVAVIAGGSASVVGFGLGSILTPVLALRLGAEVAIPAVAIPHVVATGVRLWRLRSEVNRRQVIRFGILSALGGLLGALAYTRLRGPALAVSLGALLLATAAARATGWANRWSPTVGLSWLLGGLSGFFGGVAGNQGGLRAAALSVFRLNPVELVATSTAIALMVDLGRTPVYLARAGERLSEIHIIVLTAVAGAVAGTLLGERVLVSLPRDRFRAVMSVAVGALGVWLIVRHG